MELISVPVTVFQRLVWPWLSPAATIAPSGLKATAKTLALPGAGRA